MADKTLEEYTFFDYGHNEPGSHRDTGSGSSGSGSNGWQLVTRTATQLTGRHGMPRTEVTYIFMRVVQG